MKTKTMATKKKTASMGWKCECGGTLKLTTLSNFDFARYSGIPAFLDGAPGWKCSSCGREILTGEVINASLFFIAMHVTALPHRLPAELARYLRRSMQITQQELADRMGIARETVAGWESNLKEISPQHDLILRVLTLNQAQGSAALPAKIAVHVANEMIATISGVRSEPAPRKSRDLRVTALDFKKLPAGFAGKTTSKLPASYAS
jgi:transcriptional regulator with XRE-family HTH domain